MTNHTRLLRSLVVAATLPLFAACPTIVSLDLDFDPASIDVTGGDRVSVVGDPRVGTAPLRRLTEEELNQTVRDLFPGIELPRVTLNDGEGKGFEGDVTRQTPSDLAVEQLRAAADEVSAAVVARKDLLLPRQPTGGVEDERAVGHELIASLLPRAFRRPAEERELAVYGQFFNDSLDADNFDVALRLVIQAILQSPSFVYRVELGSGRVVEGGIALAPFETASRLSYLLWGTMPDADLFAAAANGELETSEQIEAQARRMLQDPRAHDAILSFHRQWLRFDDVLQANKDAATFPQWNDDLRVAMRTEAELMIEEVIFGDSETSDAKLRSLFTTTTTRVNGALADLYGVPPPANDWDLVQLPGEQRAGVVTQGAFLASRAHAVYGSPVLRGVYVLERFLCEAPPPPTAGIDTTPPAEADEPEPTTNRSRYARHTSDTACQGCHAGIDGIGMGLESYDAVGAYRTTDNGFPVDNSGNLDGTSVGGTFSGGPGLAAMLADSEIVQGCVARQWLTWERGRGEESLDEAHTRGIIDRFAESDGDIRELLVAIATSPSFRTLPAGAMP